jgi:hypothetical protein
MMKTRVGAYTAGLLPVSHTECVFTGYTPRSRTKRLVFGARSAWGEARVTSAGFSLRMAG